MIRNPHFIERIGIIVPDETVTTPRLPMRHLGEGYYTDDPNATLEDLKSEAAEVIAKIRLAGSGAT